MDPRIDYTALRNAFWASLIFASTFAGFTFLLVLLVVAVPVARPERLGFAAATFAGSVAMWTVCWLLHKARHPKPPKPKRSTRH